MGQPEVHDQIARGLATAIRTLQYVRGQAERAAFYGVEDDVQNITVELQRLAIDAQLRANRLRRSRI